MSITPCSEGPVQPFIVSGIAAVSFFLEYEGTAPQAFLNHPESVAKGPGACIDPNARRQAGVRTK
jgi:hypothetical protein